MIAWPRRWSPMQPVKSMDLRRPNGAQLRPHRRALTIVLSLLAVAGASGGVQLMIGAYTPPVRDLEPLGLNSWLLPGVWLMASVAIPSAVAAVQAARGG